MGLVAPLFLLGLLGLALPWLLHRLNEQNAPVEDFPSTQFLEQGRSVSSREKKLKYLKLLALRVLMLLALCLLFAEPIFNRFENASADAESIHLIAVDQSFSMRHADRWETATSEAETILSSIPAQATTQLLGLDSKLVVLTQPTTDKTALSASIRTLEPGDGSFNYSDAMRWIDAFAEKQSVPVSVYLVTDTQMSAMPARLNELQARHIDALDVVPVKSGIETNLSVNASIEAMDEERFRVLAEIRGFGLQNTSEGVVVHLEKEGDLVASETAQLDERGFANLSFEGLEWPAPNRLENYRVALALSDQLPGDDVALLPVRALPFSEVRIADADFSGRIDNRVESIYLKTAVELDKRNRVTTSRLNSAGISDDTDVLIYLDDQRQALDNLPELPSEIADYLASGGNVLYVLNGEGVEKASDTTVSRVDVSHPINLSLNEWAAVDFYTQRRYDVSRSDKSLVTIGGGFPVLVESSRAQGRLLWLNASLNGQNNNLPVSPVFVPFMQGVIDFFVRNDSYPSHLSVGQSVKLGKRVQIVDPDGEQLLDLAGTTDVVREVLNKPGVYTILDKRGEYSLVVAPDPLESDIRAADEEVINNWQFSSAAGSDKAGVEEQESTLSAVGDSTRDTVSLLKWLLPVCALLLLLESLYANYHLRVRRTA